MKKVAVIFGGMSSEHDVSIISGKSVLKNIDKQKYDVTLKRQKKLVQKVPL